MKKDEIKEKLKFMEKIVKASLKKSNKSLSK